MSTLVKGFNLVPGHFSACGQRIWPHSWTLFSPRLCLTLVEVHLSKARLEGHIKYHDSKQSQTDITQILPQQPTSNLCPFCDKVCVKVTALMCRINNKNKNTYWLSGPSEHPALRQKIELVVTQYRACNMTEASWCIYTLIYPFTGPATNHCSENGLSHFRIMECPNVHIISLQLVTHSFYTCNYRALQ